MLSPVYLRAKQRVERAFVGFSPVSFSTRLWFVRFADIALIVAGCSLTAAAAEWVVGYSIRQLNFAFLGLSVAIVFVLLNDAMKLYRHSKLNDLNQQIRGVLVNWFLAWVVMAFVAFALKAGGSMSRSTVFALIIGGVPAFTLNRYLVKRWLARAASAARIARDRVGLLHVGPGAELSPEIAQLVQSVVTLSIPTANHDQAELVEAFVRDCQREDVNRILICAEPGELARIDTIRDAFRLVPVQVIVFVDNWLTEIFRRPLQLANGMTAFELNVPPLSMPERALKRGADILFAGIGLLLLAPMMAAVAVAIRLESPGPAIFRQRRLGFNGREFSILKFRSMRVMENGAEIRQAQQNDPRVTRIGRFIRANSIDELPQLWNVLVGDMSLVGPRPHAIAHDRYYDTRIADYSLRRHMRPGVTGWAQVNGRRGETPNDAAMAERVRFDLWYINNWSIWLDLWIMVKTAYELIRNRNVY